MMLVASDDTNAFMESFMTGYSIDGNIAMIYRHLKTGE